MFPPTAHPLLCSKKLNRLCSKLELLNLQTSLTDPLLDLFYSCLGLLGLDQKLELIAIICLK